MPVGCGNKAPVNRQTDRQRDRAVEGFLVRVSIMLVRVHIHDQSAIGRQIHHDRVKLEVPVHKIFKIMGKKQLMSQRETLPFFSDLKHPVVAHAQITHFISRRLKTVSAPYFLKNFIRSIVVYSSFFTAHVSVELWFGNLSTFFLTYSSTTRRKS